MAAEKSLKKRLSSIFKTAAFFVTLAVIGYGDNTAKPVALPSAPLTDGEIALVQSIFGNEVNTAIVKKHFNPVARYEVSNNDTIDAAAAVNDQKNVTFYGAEYHSADYSREELINYGTFIHEMTHIWQRQKIGGFNLLLMSCHTYDYSLDAQSRFSDFCIEQQGIVIQVYAQRFLHPSHVSLRINNTPENDLLLQKVVEEQFPQARITRLALEAQEQLKTAAAKTKSLKI